MKRIVALAALSLVVTAAHAQTVIQSGPWSPGHFPVYYPMGSGSSTPLVIDGGAAGGGSAFVQGGTEQLLIAPASPTGPGLTNWCDYDTNPANAPTGYHVLCFSPKASGGGLIYYGAGGGAAPLPLNFNINGVVTQAGSSVTGIAIPATVTGGVSGGIPYFSSHPIMGASPLLTANALMIGGGAGAAPSTITTGAGVNTALGINPGTTGSFTKQNGAITTGHMLSWGPGITDGGVLGGLTVGTTPISGGTNGDFPFNNSGVLGEVAPTGTGNVVLSTGPVLVTPNLGTPSAAILTNATGCPVSSCVSGLQTGVATALTTAVNTSGGFSTINGSPTIGHTMIWSASGIQDGGPSISTGLVIGTTTTSGGAAGQLMFDSGSVLQESANLTFAASNLTITSSANVSKGTQPTITGGGGSCAAGAKAGGSIAGTVTLTGACAAANTLVFTVMPTVPTGYNCTAQDRTQPATLLNETATSTSGVTFTVSGTTSGGTDVIQWSCPMGY